MHTDTELLSIARRLEMLAVEHNALGPNRSSLHVASVLLEIRRKRDAILGGGYFGEPAWDMLLDMFVNEGRSRMVSASSVCVAAAVPSTTALRYLSSLTKGGLVRSAPDPDDGRRRYMSLTDTARNMLDQVLSR